jgi:hypothetical protein
MIIIGITGAIHHGKTSLGEDLQALVPYATHYETSQLIMNLADEWLATISATPSAGDLEAINKWLKTLVPIIKRDLEVDCQLEQIQLDAAAMEAHPEEYEKLMAFLQKPDNTDKETARPLLQWLGGYLVNKVDGGIWYNQIVREINRDQNNQVVMSTVGGLRFPKDAEILKAAGGVIVGIERPGSEEPDLSDPTERDRQHIQLDTLVTNDGDLTDLQNCARLVYQDIISNQIKPRYRAISSGS